MSFPQNLQLLVQDATYYVSNTGNNANTGVSADVPFLNLQAAVDFICQNLIVPVGISATIQLADGTYNESISTGVVLGGGTVAINGDSTTPTNVVLSSSSSPAFYCQAGTWELQNLQVQSTSSYGVVAENSGAVVLIGTGVAFGSCGIAQVMANLNGTVRINGNYSINASSPTHYFTTNGGRIFADTAVTVTLTGTPAFSNRFVDAENASGVSVPNFTFSGSATGSRYAANLNSVIYTNGGGANYFPGNSAGAVFNGGQYD